MLQFAYTILYVPDVLQTIEFYEQAFGLKRKFVSEGNEYGELHTGNTTLSFASVNLMEHLSPGGMHISKKTDKPLGAEIAFTTKNVQQAFDQAVKNGAESVHEPEQKPWGQTVAYVRDLNGFLVELCTPMS